MDKTRRVFPAVMKSAAAISGGIVLLLLLVSLHISRGWILPAVITFGTTCYHFSMRLLVGMIIPKVFSDIDPDHRWFRPKACEAQLYRFLRIKKWKKYVPTYAPDSFSLALPLKQIARTMCISELVHIVIVFLSFLPLLLAIPFGEFPVFLITSLAAAGIDCVFILLQRYNRPRVLRLMAKRRPVNE